MDISRTERKWVSFRKLEHAIRFDRGALRRLAANREARYRPFHKVHGKKERHIDGPVGLLKEVQDALARRVLRDWEPPPEMYGAVRGRSAYDNARQHLGASVLAKIDIRNYYPSITEEHVRSALVRHLGCSLPVALLLAQLTTINDHLPQGAPSSGIVANMVLADFCHDLRRALAPMGVTFTIFVDDVGLSGARAREAAEIAITMLGSHGFHVSPHKVAIMPRHKCAQTLTGYTTNRPLARDTVSVGQARTRKIRGGMLRVARDPTAPHATLLKLRRQAQWVQSASPSQGESLRRLADKVLPVKGVRCPVPPHSSDKPCDCALGAGLGSSRALERGAPGSSLSGGPVCALSSR